MNAELSNPSGKTETWIAYSEAMRTRATVEADSWFKARQMAAVVLGAEPASLVVRRVGA